MNHHKWTQEENNKVLEIILNNYRTRDFSIIINYIVEEIDTTIGSVKMVIKNLIFILSEGERGLSGFNSRQLKAIEYILEKFNISRSKLLMILD